MKIKSLLIKLFIASYVLFGLTGCEVYREHQGVKHFQWAKKDVKIFKKGLDKNTKYDIYIALRHMTAIADDDFKVKMMIKTPAGEGTEKSFVIPIRNPETNEFYGEVAHQLCDTELVVLPSHELPEDGEYTFEISSDMEKDVSVGIMEVGLVIKKAE
jgi:gliding motility-associated lipoprotein GldH